jgi:hypothetical protein
MNEKRFSVSFSPDQLEDEELTLDEIATHSARHFIVKTTPINSLNRNQIGTFSIDHDLFTPDRFYIVQRILKDLIIVQADMRFSTNAVHYVAIGEAFEAVEQGQMPLEYHAIYDHKLGVQFALQP